MELLIATCRSSSDATDASGAAMVRDVFARVMELVVAAASKKSGFDGDKPSQQLCRAVVEYLCGTSQKQPCRRVCVRMGLPIVLATSTAGAKQCWWWHASTGLRSRVSSLHLCSMCACDCDVVAENGLIEDSLSLVSLMRQSGVAVSRRVTSDIVRGMALGSPTRPRDPSLALGFLMGLATSKTAALDADVYNSMIDVLVKVHAEQCCILLVRCGLASASDDFSGAAATQQNTHTL